LYKPLSLSTFGKVISLKDGNYFEYNIHGMRSQLLIILFFSVSISLIAQQPENYSFEEWEMVGFQNEFPEPVNWSSLKTTDPDNLGNLAPEVLFKSTDAHSGSFSVHLINKPVFGLVANGIVTNGRLHGNFNPELGYTYTDPDDSQWNTPFTERPDSIVGYYKYIPADNDIAVVEAVLHIGATTIPNPDSANWVGSAKANLSSENVTVWTRFSIPFVYYSDLDPEFILITLSAGNGHNAVAGSEAWFDDIELVYNIDGIDEKVAGNQLNAYGYENTIVADLTRISNGTSFELSVYDLTGKLINRRSMESGFKYEINDFQSGLYICSFQSSDGIVITKKVVVR
jgi:hypothetical protein